MNFEKTTTQEPSESEQGILFEQVERSSRLKKLIASEFRDLISSNLKRCKENVAEIELSLGMQLGLFALFLNENIGDLNSYFDLPGTGETVFVDKRVIAMIVSNVLVKSAGRLKNYLKEHGHESRESIVESAV